MPISLIWFLPMDPEPPKTTLTPFLTLNRLFLRIFKANSLFINASIFNTFQDAMHAKWVFELK